MFSPINTKSSDSTYISTRYRIDHSFRLSGVRARPLPLQTNTILSIFSLLVSLGLLTASITSCSIQSIKAPGTGQDIYTTSNKPSNLLEAPDDNPTIHKINPDFATQQSFSTNAIDGVIYINYRIELRSLDELLTQPVNILPTTQLSSDSFLPISIKLTVTDIVGNYLDSAIINTRMFQQTRNLVESSYRLSITQPVIEPSAITVSFKYQLLTNTPQAEQFFWQPSRKKNRGNFIF